MSKQVVKFPKLHSNAAGIDVGSKSHWVCAGDEEIREFEVFTEDLHEMAKWLQSLGVQSIAMESTGFYWKSLYLLLQDYGFELLLVHPSETKNAKGKKSDKGDCHLIWQLHSAGLLSGSFQPDDLTEKLRIYTRHRKSLIDGAARYISKMQKSLVLQNVHLSVVLTDISGKSGRAIIQAILKGERNSKILANLADSRVKASKAVIAKALTGNWKEQHLFELKQCYEMYEFYHTQIAQCDVQIEAVLNQELEQNYQNDLAYEPKKKRVVLKMTPNLTWHKKFIN